MKGEQNVIPSLVWLELFDRMTVDIRKSSYFFDSSVYRINEVEDTSGNREIDIFWSYVAVSLGQGDSEDIQAATDHINDRSGLSINYQRERFPLKPSLNDIILGVSIWLDDSDIWAAFDPSVNPLVKNLDLGYGPIYGGISARSGC